MKKFLLSIVLLLILGFLAQTFFPWWSVAIVAAAIGFIMKFDNGLWSYVAGFIAVAVLWGGYAGYIDTNNAHLLSTKMGNLFGALSSFSMILLTSLIGGIVGGFGALTGYFGNRLVSH